MNRQRIADQPDRSRRVNIGVRTDDAQRVHLKGAVAQCCVYGTVAVNGYILERDREFAKAKIAVEVTAYLGFLFMNSKLVAIDVGGGV